MRAIGCRGERPEPLWAPGRGAEAEGAPCRVREYGDGSGRACTRAYPVFPGIELTYNDVHMAACGLDAALPRRVLEIDHCREGRMERETGNEYFYLSEGDLSIHMRAGEERQSFFPLSHYHGITVAVDLDRAPKCLSCILEDVAVDPSVLAEKFCPGGKCTVIRKKPCFEHIFSELYSIPEDIRRGYLKIKVMELLLFLSAMDAKRDAAIANSYFSRAQVEAVKAVKQYLMEHTERHITAEELAGRFGLSQTTLKSCFKGVFGVSLYAFSRSYRMQKAALLLRETDKTVMEIAGMLGYDNGSKFAKAFRDAMGLSPKDYRNIPAQMELNSARLERI